MQTCCLRRRDAQPFRRADSQIALPIKDSMPLKLIAKKPWQLLVMGTRVRVDFFAELYQAIQRRRQAPTRRSASNRD
jgi:hypothetical protein